MKAKLVQAKNDIAKYQEEIKNAKFMDLELSDILEEMQRDNTNQTSLLKKAREQARNDNQGEVVIEGAIQLMFPSID